MGRPVPENDNDEIKDLSAAEIAAHNADTDAGNDEQEEDAGETAETAEAGEAADTENADDTFSETGLEAVLAESGGDRSGWVPPSRVSELSADIKAARRDADIARELAQQLLAERAQGAATTTKAQDAATVRDFVAELKALREQYRAGDLEEDAYDDARNALILEQAEDRITQKIAPKMQELESEVATTRQEKAQAAINAAAAPLIKKYPFLDIADEAGRNMDAIAAVQKVRNELVKTGVPFIRAMQLAVAEVAPDFASGSRAVTDVVEDETGETDEAANVTEIRNKRAQQGRVAAVKAANATPPSTTGVGVSDGAPAAKQVLTRSVEDAEKWEKMNPQQRRAAVIPN